MKNYYLRSCVALTCALSMAACGGSDREMALYVSVFGVTMSGLTLTNNGGPALAVTPGVSTVQFPDPVREDSNFEIKIASSPPNATCELRNAKGKIGAYSPNNIAVVCTVFTYDLGGKIKNLAGDGLILVNGSDRKTFNAVPGTVSLDFNMTIPAVAAVAATATTPAVAAVAESGKVAEGSPYGVLIYQQPTVGNCRIETAGTPPVSTGVGIMPRGKVESIIIQC